jgi:hypothetical protein
MGMPKSVVKINKDGVNYTSSVDKTQYTMMELERAALRDAGKFLKRTVKALIPKDEGHARKSLGVWVRKPWKNRAAHLQIGVYNKKTAEKKGLFYVGYFHLIEFGSRKLRGLRPITNGTKGNIETVRKIQAQYLGYIEDEIKALSVIDEGDEEDDS